MLLRWVLIPSWAKDAKIGNQCINAKGETVAQKSAFRAAFKKRRCIIISDGFYEWQHQGTRKHPYWIGRKDRRPFAFAGLWEHWQFRRKLSFTTSSVMVQFQQRYQKRQRVSPLPISTPQEGASGTRCPSTGMHDRHRHIPAQLVCVLRSNCGVTWITPANVFTPLACAECRTW